MASIVVLNKRKTLKMSEIEKLQQSRAVLEAESEELVESVDGMETEKDITDVESRLNEIEAELESLAEQLSGVEQEVAVIDSEIESANERTQEAVKRSAEKAVAKKGDIMVPDIKMRAKSAAEKRTRMAHAIKLPEVRKFFEQIAEHIQKRAITNTDILIPETLINMIEIDSQDVGKVSKLVKHQSANGTARVIIAGDTPEAIWLDCCGALTELDLNFGQTEMDCYKVGGYMAICNSTLDDAFIDLGVHIVEQLTVSLNKAEDKAIVNGTGSAGKQPSGIIPNLPAANKVDSESAFPKYMANYALLPDDATEITHLMTRKTFYTKFAPQTIATTSAGQIVAQNTGNAIMPDGTSVVFVKNDIVPDDKVLLGDYSKYLILDRQGMTVARSTEVRWIEEQTLFKATKRLDGKPIKPEYWVLVSLVEVNP